MSGDPAAAVAATEWRAAHDRLVALVTAVGDAGMEVRVPATPDWTARDLFSHVVGLGADVLGGDEPDDHNPGWTQRQVDARADRSASELVAEWRGLADDLERYVRETDPRPLNDVVIHEQDLRGALGEPGGRDTAGLARVRETMTGRFAAAVGGLPPIRLDGGDWSWTSGDGEPAVVVTAPAFDLFRALTARRTEAQLRGWTTRGDVGPYLDAFAALGPLPENPLPE